MRRALALTLVIPFLAGAATANADGTAKQQFTAAVLLVVRADQRVRDCTAECSHTIHKLRSYSLFGYVAMKRTPTGEAPFRRAAMAGFLRWWLAAGAFRRGDYGQYVSNLKQAISHLNTAAILSGTDTTFDLILRTHGCKDWRLALRVPGRGPCE